MRILVDENIPARSVRALRAMGHEVDDLRGTPDAGMSDEALWQRVLQQEALLVTTDKGFVRHRSEPHYGMLIIRLRQPNRMKINERVLHAIDQFDQSQWRGLTVVMRDRVQSIRRARRGKE